MAEAVRPESAARLRWLVLGSACWLPLSSLPGFADSPLGGLSRLVFASSAPGLLLLLATWRWTRNDLAATALRALALSPLVLFCLTLPLVWGLGVPLPLAATATCWVIFLALLALLGCRPRESQDSGAGRPVLVWVPLVCFGLMAAGVFSQIGARVSYHGVLHAGLVAQIATGTIPPENPAMGGAPLAFYWAYHWVLAIHGALAGLSILETGPFLNAVSLMLYVGVGQRILSRFGSDGWAAVGAVAAGFAVNLCVPIVFVVSSASEGAPVAFMWPFELLSAGTPAGDPRLVTLLGKFLSVSGFPLGLGLWALLLGELLPSTRKRRSLVVTFLAACSILLFHVTTAVAAYAALGLGTLSVALPELRRHTPRAWLREWGAAPAVLAAALAVTAPYLWSITAGSGAISHSPVAGSSVLSYNASGILSSATPVVAITLIAGGLRVGGQPLARFLLTATTTLLLLGLLVHLPDGNQYKFSLVSALPAGLLAFWLLREDGAIAARKLRRVAVAVIVLLALASHAITSAAFFLAPMSKRDLFAGDGAYLAVPGDPALDDALHWLRHETPRQAIVISKPVRYGGSPVSAGSGRSNYVLQGGHHTRGLAAYPRRLEGVMRLFSLEGHASPVAVALQAEIDRPLYVLLLRGQFPERFEALTQRFDAAAEVLTPVYRKPDAVIYAIERR